MIFVMGINNLQESSTIMYESTFVCPFSTFWARLPGRVVAYLPYFPSYSLHCSTLGLYFHLTLHFPYYSFSPLFSISLSKQLHLSPLFSILHSQYVPSCFAVLLYITISQFSILFSTILHITLYIVQLNPLNSTHSTLLHITTLFPSTIFWFHIL